MSAITVLLIFLIFGIIFWLAGRHASGSFRQCIQFLAGAIIVAVLVIYLLQLFGYSGRLP